MSKNKEGKKQEKGNEVKKCKEVCCEKYLKKGKHCKDCPLAGECRLPG